MKQELLDAFVKFASVPSTSGNEFEVINIIKSELTKLGLKYNVDQNGNIKASLEGTGKPVLLNAHMDRVKPGFAYTPIIKGDLIYSNGNTNSGADDVLGIIAILNILKALRNSKNHRPLSVIFTVQEEIGGFNGAKSVDITDIGTDEGIIIDNAFDEVGIVVEKGSNLVWIFNTINGKSVHSGKDIDEGINALSILLESQIKPGKYNNDETRVNIGNITVSPGVGNAVPGEVTFLTEIRSFLGEDDLNIFIDDIFSGLHKAAALKGATIETKIEPHMQNYEADMDEPLIKSYKALLENDHRQFLTRPTFVGSDANSFRSRGLKTFVVSTGARNEHTFGEYFDLNGITSLTTDLIELLS